MVACMGAKFDRSYWARSISSGCSRIRWYLCVR